MKGNGKGKDVCALNESIFENLASNVFSLLFVILFLCALTLHAPSTLWRMNYSHENIFLYRAGEFHKWKKYLNFSKIFQNFLKLTLKGFIDALVLVLLMIIFKFSILLLLLFSSCWSLERSKWGWCPKKLAIIIFEWVEGKWNGWWFFTFIQPFSRTSHWSSFLHIRCRWGWTAWCLLLYINWGGITAATASCQQDLIGTFLKIFFKF